MADCLSKVINIQSSYFNLEAPRCLS